MVNSRRIMGLIHPKACNVLKNEVFPPLREDEVVKCIRHDELVIIFGNKLCQKYREKHLQYHIRQQLRTLGRFMLALKTIDSTVTDFASVFHPRCYDNVIAAVNKLASLNESSATYKSPTLAFFVGTLLKKSGLLLISECIKNGNCQKKKHVEDFLDLLKEDYGTSINKTVYFNQLQHKRDKALKLPNRNDIILFHDYIKDKRDQYFNELQSGFQYSKWLELAKFTLAYTLLFNRRRPGEIERIWVSEFEKYVGIDKITDTDLYNSLSAAERSCAKNYVRFVIRGKLAQGVPVLLDYQMVKCYKQLIKNRTEAGVSQANPYIFGIPGGATQENKHLQACPIIRLYSMQCGARNPETIRATALRKQIATAVQALNLKESEVSYLSKFMGHTGRVHKDYYELPAAAIDMGVMSTLLEVVQEGNLEKYRGKSFKQISQESKFLFIFLFCFYMLFYI